MSDHYHSDDEVAAVVAGFENCTTTEDKFTHLSHLTVATYYLRTSTPEETFAKMRLGLLRFLNHHGGDPAKYNDRVTRAWIKQVQNVIDQMDDKSSLVAITNVVLDRLVHFQIPRAATPDDSQDQSRS